MFDSNTVPYRCHDPTVLSWTVLKVISQGDSAAQSEQRIEIRRYVGEPWTSCGPWIFGVFVYHAESHEGCFQMSYPLEIKRQQGRYKSSDYFPATTHNFTKDCALLSWNDSRTYWSKCGRAHSCMRELASRFPFIKLGTLICYLSLPIHYQLEIWPNVVGVDWLNDCLIDYLHLGWNPYSPNAPRP